MYNCAMCGINACKKGLKNAPKGCPSFDERINKLNELYKIEGNKTIGKTAAEVAEIKTMTRIEETMEFARRCNYKKIGIAFCSALIKEAAIIDKIFIANGFETESIICKIGSSSKAVVGMEGSKAPICNPIVQAKFLNEQKTEFNVVVGLCVGHDSLFYKNSEAPVTTLIVKDKVLAHNPVGAIYMAESYYKNKLYPNSNTYAEGT